MKEVKLIKVYTGRIKPRYFKLGDKFIRVTNAGGRGNYLYQQIKNRWLSGCIIITFRLFSNLAPITPDEWERAYNECTNKPKYGY